MSLIVFAYPTTPIGPRDRAFDDPTARLHLKPNLIIGARDDLNRDAQTLGNFIQKLAALTGISPCIVHVRTEFLHLIQDRFCPVTVLNVGRLNCYDQQVALSSNGELPLTPVHLFFPIKAALAAGFGRLDRLAIEHHRSRVRCATLVPAHFTP